MNFATSHLAVDHVLWVLFFLHDPRISSPVSCPSSNVNYCEFTLTKFESLRQYIFILTVIKQRYSECMLLSNIYTSNESNNGFDIIIQLT